MENIDPSVCAVEFRLLCMMSTASLALCAAVILLLT